MRCTPVVGVDQQSGVGGAVADGHVQRAGDRRRGLTAVDRPAHDPAGEGVQDDRAVDLAFAGAVLSDVGDPQLTARMWNRVQLPVRVYRDWYLGSWRRGCQSEAWLIGGPGRVPLGPAPQAASRVPGGTRSWGVSRIWYSLKVSPG